MKTQNKQILFALLCILLTIVSCVKNITPDGSDLERSSTSVAQISNHLSPNGYDIYKSVVGTDTSYYSNASVLLNFNASYGVQSLNIFGFESPNGVVNVNDLNNILSGYGVIPPFNWDLYQCEIFGQFSSGWFMSHPEWDAIFLKPTPQDELNNDYTPDELRSFVIEGSIDGVNYKIWYYKK